MINTAKVLAQAWQRHQAGDLGQAEAMYRQVLDADPRSLEALYLLGMLYLGQGKAAESIPLYQRLLQLKPDSAEVHNNLGVAYAIQGRLTEAMAHYGEAVRLKPDHAEALNNLGMIHGAQGDWDQAIASYRRALALKPRYPEALNNLGIALFQKQQLDEAGRCFQEALALWPEFADAHNNLGNTLLAQGKPTEASQCYRQALQLRPNDAKTHSNLGIVCTQLQQWEEAAACWQRSLSISPDDPQTLCNLARSWVLQGCFDEALSCYRRLLTLRPEDVEVRLLIEALSNAPPPERVPADFVTNLFNSYAASFDRDLLERLGYRGPDLLKSALGPAPAARSLVVLDLGCGTGLCGLQFRDWAKDLIGVDLSPKMLAVARQRGIYDELLESDLLAAVQQSESRFDLVVAGDVFVYLGDLGPLFAGIHRALRPGGRLAFTVEHLEGTGYRLLPTLRFAHSRDYLQQLATRTQLQPVIMNEAVLRTEQGQDAPGLVVVLSRPRE
jgi:predicted TPR repeat methyltransferase